MLRLVLPDNRQRPFQLLCLGAHGDDIEIGCGGTILRLAAEVPDLAVRWVVFSGKGNAGRAAEAQGAAAAFLHGATDIRVDVLDFRDGYFPFHGVEIKDFFENLKRDCEPSLILTHFKGDAHQDHRIIGELTHNTFRNHLVLEYEIPKYDGDLANPSFFVPLSDTLMRRKVDLLRDHFPSQRARGWFTDGTFLAIARLRGIECNAPDGFAEAFHARKIVY